MNMTALPLEELAVMALLLDEQEANKHIRKWVHCYFNNF
jgi:hypothetical protein